MKLFIALLTAATGILHLLIGLNIGIGFGAINWMLVLNGVGYLVLLFLFWTAAGSRRGTIRWILLAYTLITLIGYFVINADANFGLNNTWGLIIKAIELLLVILLFLYRPSERAVTTAPAYTTATTRTVTTPTAPLATSSMTAATGAAMAGTAAMVDRSVDATVNAADEAVVETDSFLDKVGDRAGDAIDYVGDKAEAAYDAVADTTSDAVHYVGDKAEDAYHAVADTTSDAVDYVGDKVEAAYDAVADTTGDAVDYVDDKADAAYDAVAGAVGGAVAYAGDKAEDAYDAVADTTSDVVDYTGDAVRGAGAAVVGAVGGAADEVQDLTTTSAAELDAAQLHAEPSAADLRKELEEYLRSFGPSSEFRKEIEYIEGIGPVFGQKLRGAGIVTVIDLLVNGATRRGRKQISDQTGLAQSQILTWVNHVDLFRIKGVAQEYADLLEQSGVDTVVELAQRNPANLHKRMLDINEQRALVRRAPHASEVQSWVEQAKSLRRLIYY